MPEHELQFVPEEYREEHRYNLQEIQDLYQEASKENVPVSAMSDYADPKDPFLQFGRYSQDISPDFEEKLRRVDRNVPLPEYLGNMIAVIEGELDPQKTKIHAPASFGESRFISAREIWEKKQQSCGSLSNLAASALRREFIPTKLIHGFIQEKQGEDRHAWIEVYFPTIEKWIPFDLTNTFGYRISENHVKMREYRDWEQLEEDYQKGKF